MEFTESTFFENTDLVQSVMNQLHEMGFVIYMDDFGSGYSALNMLHTLPVDTLKIDKEFLPKNPYEERGGRVLAAVTRMAGWLNMPVIVEGAENPQQISFLREAGCDYVQGYFFARPMNEASYAQLLDRRDGGRLLLPEEAPQGKVLTELWTSDALVEKLFENIAQPMAVIQISGDDITTLRVNSAFLASFGSITSGDYVQELVACIPKKQDRDEMRQAMNTAAQGNHTAQCEFSCVLKKENVWLSVKFQFVEKIMGHANILTMVISDISDKVLVQQALGRSEQEAKFQEQYASIVLRNARIIAWSYDVQNNEFHYPEDYSEDADVEELVDVPEKLIRRNLIHPDDVEGLIAMYEALRKGAPKAEGIFRFKTNHINDIKYRYFRIRYTNTFDMDGKPYRAVGMMQDITDVQEMRASYYTELDFNQILSRDTVASMLINLTQKSVEKEQIFIDSKERIFKHMTFDNYAQVLASFIGQEEEATDFISKMQPEALAAAFNRGEQYFQYVFHKVWHRTGKRTWMSAEIYIRSRKENEDLLAQIYIKDINEQTLRIKELEEAASMDQMTGLYNHDAFIHKMQQFLEKDGKEGIHALYMIDINDFKKLNDTYGHHLGDMAIIRIAEELSTSFRKTDILGRFGGDEFVVLAKNIGSEQLSILKKKQLAKSLELTVVKEDTPISFNCCIGCAVCTDADKDFFALFNEADNEMYKEKKKRKEGTSFADTGRH